LRRIICGGGEANYAEYILKRGGKAHIDRWRIPSRSRAKVIYVGDDGLKAILGHVVGFDTLAEAKLDDGGDCRAVIRDKDCLDSSQFRSCQPPCLP
jgi:hypothetical protein